MTGGTEEAKAGNAPRLASLAASLGAAKTRGPAPVDSWHPPYCGEIDLLIAKDGRWFYAGTPILRPGLVALFAGILRKDADRHVLVTPVECVGITVEDAPFIGVAMSEQDGTLIVTTNMGDEVRAGPDHAFRFTIDDAGGVKPYIRVRGGLWAKLTRSLAVELLDRGTMREEGGVGVFGISSGGTFFPLGAGDRPEDA